MKKLTVLIGAILVAAVSSAATFSWKLQTGADYSRMDVYALKGTTAASVLAACISADAETWLTPFAGSTSFKVTGTGARAGAAGKSDGISAEDNLVFVIVDGAIAEGSKYWVLNDYAIPSGNVYTPPDTAPLASIGLTTVGTAGTGTFTAVAVPEPTSGLLLLLGVAGLALRRRHA